MHRRPRVLVPAMLIVAAAVLAVPAPLRAQQKLLTLNDIYDPETKVDFSGTPPSGLVWVDDAHYLWPKPTKVDAKTERFEWLKVEAATGRTEPFFDAAKMEAAIAKLPGMRQDEARRLAHERSYRMNPKRTAIVLTIEDDLYYYEFGSDTITRLTFTPSEEHDISFSPDGRLVAFVRDHNLSLVDVATQHERALTTDGNDHLLNGELDWVYQEEIYGRGNFRAYAWSPDSSWIAFLQLNEKPVPAFTVVDHIPYRQDLERAPYPKAGDPNPLVKIGVVRVTGGTPRWMDNEKYGAIEFLIVHFTWTDDSRSLVYQVQNREQTWLDLDFADPTAGSAKTVLHETTRAWVDRNDDPEWLKDGSFLWLSERTGWKHIYHYKADGTLVKQVTDGKWEVRDLHGVDEATGWVYFSGTERSPIGSDVYRVKLDGTRLARLSKADGSHRAQFDPSFAAYLDSWSDVTTPTQVRLHKADGSEVRVIDDNKVPALAQYKLAKPEFLQVKTRDGFVMEAMIIKPPDFDASKKYPVYQQTYGGPHSQQVRNAWGGATYMYHQLLAEKGIVVWICDNRTASGKGAESTWQVYKNFGELELRDIEDGLSYLKQQSWVDPSRIGINGWSFGGFMVSYALTHSSSFAMGIAGGSVTDWRDYDSIYTERYMAMPQNNQEGYRKSAPRAAAKNLHGHLLLIHGTMDDNVHMQNTIQFAYELQEAGKPFRLMVYPKSRHGVTDPLLVKHMRELMLDFVLENLKPERASVRVSSRLQRAPSCVEPGGPGTVPGASKPSDAT
jgi:dipeptidyl-peptidase-4